MTEIKKEFDVETFNEFYQLFETLDLSPEEAVGIMAHITGQVVQLEEWPQDKFHAIVTTNIENGVAYVRSKLGRTQ